MDNALHSLESYLDSVRENRLHFLILVLVLPWFVPLIGYMLLGPLYFRDLKVFATGTLLNFFLCLIAHSVDQHIAGRVGKWFPETHQSVTRVILLFVLFSIINIGLLYLTVTVYSRTGWYAYANEKGHFWYTVFIMAGTSLVGAGLSELAYAFMQWKTNQLELQQLEQKQLQSELEVVKQQVNPHFLFSCLNSLSVLISEAPAAAEKFVDEMSKVYRYLLHVGVSDKDSFLVSLESELRFIRSYSYLLETRYENGIRITIEVDELYLSGRLAPLTLQILVDNAIRHNIVAAGQPLKIRISTTSLGRLEVRNNLQRRLTGVPPHGEGLATLMSRYKILFNRAGAIQVREDVSSFTVTLSLIHS